MSTHEHDACCFNSALHLQATYCGEGDGVWRNYCLSSYMHADHKKSSWFIWAGRIGLSAKGLVYCLIGLIAVFAALHIGGRSANDIGQAKVFNLVEDQPMGKAILIVIGLGLACFTAWRLIQAFNDTEHKGKHKGGIAKRATYLYSGLLYAGVAWYALRTAGGDNTNGSAKQGYISKLLSVSHGQWIVGIIAGCIIATGLYQLYRAFSGKYKKYVREALHKDAAPWVSTAGVAGYTARGIVWVIIGWLFIKAAINANPAYAGGNEKAFHWLQDAWYGSYLLVLVALGLVCYGIFMFLRARYLH